MTADDLPDLIKVEEFAVWARCGRNQAYTAVQAGEIPAIRIGRSWRIPKAALLAMLNGQNGDGPPGGSGPSEVSSAGTGEDRRA